MHFRLRCLLAAASAAVGTSVLAQDMSLEARLPTLEIKKEMARQFRVTAVPLKAMELERRLKIPGVIRPDETKLVRITTVAQGRIRQIFVFPGDRVSRLHQLASLDSPELARQKSMYLQAEAKKQLAERMLDIEQQWAKLEVDARKPFDTARQQVVQARNALEVAVAQLDVAQRRYDAEKVLFEDGITSQQSLDQAKANFQKAKSDIGRARKTLDLARTNLEREQGAYDKKIITRRELQRATALLDQAEIDLEAARVNMSIYGLRPTSSTAELEQEYITKNQVVTPIAGTVIKQNVQVGDVVQPNQHLFEVADLSTVWFVGNLYEKDRNEVKVGQGMSVEVAAHKGMRFEGKVFKVFPFVEATTRTVPCIGYLFNSRRLLLPGMFANARVEVEAARPRLLVNRKAVQDYQGRTVVFRKLPEDRGEMFLYEMRDVKLGLEFDLEETPERDQLVEVLDGVEEGMEIVSEGAFSLISEYIKRGDEDEG